MPRVEGVAYFERIDERRFLAGPDTAGAWRTDEQHVAPAMGLLAHAVTRDHAARGGDLVVTRLAYDILGVLPVAAVDVTVEVVRPGRSIELVEATLSVDDRAVVRANAWRLAAHDSAPAAGVEFEPMPGPGAFPEWHATEVWEGGYIRGVEFRADPERRPGRTRTWIRSPYALVDSEPCSPTADLIRLVDTANGIAVRVSPQEWMFPNVDLTIHLFREPVRGWVGFDTKVTMGTTGMGLTSTTLHDERGPVGRAEQILTVRPMPGT